MVHANNSNPSTARVGGSVGHPIPRVASITNCGWMSFIVPSMTKKAAARPVKTRPIQINVAPPRCAEIAPVVSLLISPFLIQCLVRGLLVSRYIGTCMISRTSTSPSPATSRNCRRDRRPANLRLRRSSSCLTPGARALALFCPGWHADPERLARTDPLDQQILVNAFALRALRRRL